MSLRTKFFAMTYDRQMAKTEKAGLRAFRERLLAGASGDVLEIGGGTGANLSCYGPAVGSLTITEPQPPMLRRLEHSVRTHRVGQHRPDAKVLRAPAEDLPFDDDSFDVAVSTLVLCGVDDQPRALRELRRVLRPGGRLLFIEHVRSGDPGTARLQDRLNWLNRLVVCCDCNRPTLDSIRAACTAGRRPAHGCAASSCAASRMSAASSPNRPRKCTPIGRPSSFHQSGTDIAGLPVRLATTPA